MYNILLTVYLRLRLFFFVMYNEEDVKRIYRENIEGIFRYFFFRIFDRDTAEDLTSQTFFIFIKEVNQNQVKDPNKYIYGIARNIFLMYLREKYKNKEISADIDREDVLLEYDDDNHIDYTELLKKILPKLPKSQREIMEKRFVERLSIKEIAGILGKNENYVSTTQKRAFKTIKRILSVQKKQLT